MNKKEIEDWWTEVMALSTDMEIGGEKDLLILKANTYIDFLNGVISSVHKDKPKYYYEFIEICYFIYKIRDQIKSRSENTDAN